jgi:hypothetical protein
MRCAGGGAKRTPGRALSRYLKRSSNCFYASLRPRRAHIEENENGSVATRFAEPCGSGLHRQSRQTVPEVAIS